jgi:hypothetical protein
MSNVELGTTNWIYCNTCKGLTRHELIAVHERERVDAEFLKDPLHERGEYEEWKYLLWACRGCDTATLQEEYVSYIGGEELSELNFHPRRERSSLPLKTFRQLNEKLNSIYEEVIKSFNSDAKILCAVGLRALLEGICADKGISETTLYKKIDGLNEHLPPNIVESLHGFRFIGNEAAHELQAPSRSELQVAIEVIEDLLNFLYELDYKARSLSMGRIDESATVIRPSREVIRRIIERMPSIPQGQKDLYKALYQAGDHGLSISQMAAAMGRTKDQVYGVLGALGRRVNNTPGVEGKPGITFLLRFVQDAGAETGEDWGWAMRPELRQVLKEDNYIWARGWVE